MVSLSIETLGGEKIVRGFNRFNEHMEDLRIPLEKIASDFYKVEEEIFRSGGKPDKFQPLSDKYKKWKNKNFPGRPIMVLHGNLRGALTGRPNETSIASPIRNIKKHSGEFGVKSPYANRHQMGTAGMPQRKIVQLTEETKRRWGKIIHLYALNKAKNDIEGL